MPETLDVFRNKKAGFFLIQRKCKDQLKKGLVSYGAPEVFSEAQLRETGVEKILSGLSFSSAPCPGQELVQVLTTEEYSGFCRAHICVTVTRWPEGRGDLELFPLRRTRGGYRSIEGAKVVIEMHKIQSDLIDEVFEAFRRIEEAE